MKLYFMKRFAVDYLKANMASLYTYYYRQKTNDWLYDIFDEEPFELFMEIPDFQLAPYSEKRGEMDLENCKILFQKLMNISESQASDERLWAGLCHSSFYSYVRQRWDYQNAKLKSVDADVRTLISRFFFLGGTRSGLYRNTLARYWWIGHATYQENSNNKFEILDCLGGDDFLSKVSDLFYSNTFSSNLKITKGICRAWKMFSDRGIKLTVREYFRPALQNMNALGGGILLDILSEDEIKDIFFEYVYHLYSKDRPNAIVFENETDDGLDDESDFSDVIESNDNIELMQENFSEAIPCNDISDELEIIDYAENKYIIGTRSSEEAEDAKRFGQLMGKPSMVTYNCSVTVYRSSDDKTLYYVLPGEDDKDGWLPIMKLMLGKGIGDEIQLYTKKYTIVDIDW